MRSIGKRRTLQVALACMLALLLTLPSLGWGQLYAEAKDMDAQQPILVEEEPAEQPLAEEEISATDTVIDEESPTISLDKPATSEKASSESLDDVASVEEAEEPSDLEPTVEPVIPEEPTPAIEATKTLNEESLSALSGSLAPLGEALDPAVALENLEWKLNPVFDPPLDCDLGSDPASYSVGLSTGQTCYVTMKFDINAPNGTFNDGDTLTFPFLPQGQNACIVAGDTGAEPLLNGTTELGTWRIENYHIVIELGPNAAGKIALKDCAITTSSNLKAETFGNAATTQDYYVGPVKHTYMHKGKNRRPASGYLYKGAWSATNQDIRWSITQAELSSQLMQSNGKSIDPIGTMIIEDEFPKSTGIVDVSLADIQVGVMYVMSETDHQAAQADWSNALTRSIKSHFTKMNQLDGESYDQFKARIDTFQYGMYRTDAGDIKFIVNFGSPNSLSYPLQYFMIWPDLEQALLDANVGITPAEAQYIAKSYSSTNCIFGNIVDPTVVLDARYEQVATEAQVDNTAFLSFRQGGTWRSKKASAYAFLQAGSGTTTPTDPTPNPNPDPIPTPDPDPTDPTDPIPPFDPDKTDPTPTPNPTEATQTPEPTKEPRLVAVKRYRDGRLVETGDNNLIPIALALVSVAAVAATAALVRKKRSSRKQK